MRLPCVRFTVRWMMVAVAVVAVVIGVSVGAIKMGQQSGRYQQVAAMWADKEREQLIRVGFLKQTVWVPIGDPGPDEDEATRKYRESRARHDRQVEQTQALAGYYGQLARKYQRAASCPWIAVTPDPPPPRP